MALLWEAGELAIPFSRYFTEMALQGAALGFPVGYIAASQLVEQPGQRLRSRF